MKHLWPHPARKWSRDDKSMACVVVGLMLSAWAVVEIVYLALVGTAQLVLLHDTPWSIAISGLYYSIGVAVIIGAAAWRSWRRHYAPRRA
jgi:hypothetical protein